MTEAPTVAIVGLAVTYPDALTPADLWDTVLHQRTAFRAIPDGRLPKSEYVDQLGAGDLDLTYLTSAALVEGWSFDTDRFRVPQALYEAADMTHWMALDTAARLLGQLGSPDAADLPRDRTGVVLGNSLTGETSRANSLRLRWPFIERTLRSAAARAGTTLPDGFLAGAAAEFRAAFPAPGDETLAGALANTIAGRICNYYDFHGTGYTVDGACSSSLLAVMAARRALLSGELDLAIAGGVDMSLDPFELVGFARLNALSHGEMRVYDEQPTGFLPGEGCGLVALMRTADALDRGYPIYAVVAGAGTSSDGAGGLTRPDQKGHATAAARAYADGRIDPLDIGLFEGHGTGTGVGDPIELATFRELRHGAAVPAAVGSIKANIGHTKAAAGIAGLIKATLAVHHRILPPTTGVRQPHPLTRGNTEIEVLTEPKPWAGPRLAGVSAMGFGGINTHVVLSDADRLTGSRRPARRSDMAISTRTGPDEVWVITARTAQQLRAEVTSLAADVAVLSDAETRDLACAVTSDAELGSAYRFAFATGTTAGTLAALTTAIELLDGQDQLASASVKSLGSPQLLAARDCFLGIGPAARVGLMFPGQAAPLTAPDGVLTRLLPPGPLLDAARTGTAAAIPPAECRIDATDTRFAQPSIVAASLLGLGWLDLLGTSVHRVVGHSLGEITALVWSGALTPEEGVQLATERGRIMSEYGASGTSMAAVAADEDQTADLLAELAGRGTETTDEQARLVISGTNSIRQTTVAGPVGLLGELAELARRRAVAVHRLPVSHGFHSPAMDQAVEPFRQALERRDLQALTDGVISTVTGGPLADPSADELRVHLACQLTDPVRFREAVERLGKECQLLVECGPGRMLTTMASAATTTPAVGLDVGGRPAGLASVTAALAAAGAVTDVGPWTRSRSPRAIQRGHRPVLLTSPCGLFGPAPGPTDEAVVAPAPAQEQPASDSAPACGPTPTGDADIELTLLAIVAEVTALAPERLSPELSLLRDLHLNSLQIGQIVGRATAELGLAAPAVPLALSDATIAEVVNALEALPPASAAMTRGLLGATEWVASFADRWQPLDVAAGAAEIHLDWTTIGTALPADGAGLAGRRGLLVVLDGGAEDDQRVVAAIEAATAASFELIVIAHQGSGAGLGRSLALELEQPPRIICVETTRPVTDWLSFPPRLSGRFHDLQFDGEAWRSRFTERWIGPGIDLGLARGDTCIVTGGLTGITAECVAELAARVPVTLVFTGRTTATDERIVSKLADLSEAGIAAQYVCCDVTDAVQVAGLYRAASAFGPVRGLIHGAGINTPQPLDAVTTESLAATSKVKAGAFDLLLDQCPDRDALRLVVTFGSIIGRAGLPGQTDYCLANDRLRHRTEIAAAQLPDAVVRHLEWSVWSGVGMGVELGVLDALARGGVAAIGPPDGRALFVEAVSTSGPVTRLLAGRLPERVTVMWSAEPLPMVRFTESVVSRTPGVELIVESEVSTATDVALADHRIDGVPVLPGVVSLEAIAQVASSLAPDRNWRRFTDLRLRQPVTAGDDGPTTLRLAAAHAQDGKAIAVNVRSDNDGFATDAVTALVHATEACPPVSTFRPDGSQPPALTHLYGPLFFHGPAFQRVAALHTVSASKLDVTLTSTDRDWFSAFLPRDLLLGDPGLLDASIHALQACYPGRRLLPVSAEEFCLHREIRAGSLRMMAAERVDVPADSADVCFDVVVGDDEGPVLEWSGLLLRRVGDLAGQYADRVLLGAHLARRIRELGWCPLFDATVGAATDPVAEAAGLLGAGSVRHSPAGLLESDNGFVSTSRSDAHRITVWSPNQRVGADWVTLRRGDREPVLRSEDAALAGRLAAGLPSAAMVWAAREAALKAGRPYDAELVATGVEDDHSAVFRIAGGDVLVEVVANEAVSEVLAVFVGTQPAGEEPR